MGIKCVRARTLPVPNGFVPGLYRHQVGLCRDFSGPFAVSDDASLYICVPNLAWASKADGWLMRLIFHHYNLPIALNFYQSFVWNRAGTIRHERSKTEQFLALEGVFCIR